VIALKRREPVRLVGSRILVVADADERLLEQANDRRDHVLAAQLGPAQVGLHALPHADRRPPEREELAELRLVAVLAPLRVIAILLPPTGVAAGRLDVAVRARSALMRARTLGSRTGRPRASRYAKRFPRGFRVIPSRVSAMYLLLEPHRIERDRDRHGCARAMQAPCRYVVCR